MVETIDRFRITNLIRIAKSTSDEDTKEKLLKEAYDMLSLLNEKSAYNASVTDILDEYSLVAKENIEEQYLSDEKYNAMVETTPFDYIYEAEPLDFRNHLTIPYTEYIKHYDGIEKDKILNKIQAIKSWISSIGERIRTYEADIEVFPYICGYVACPVYVAKVDNNGTTYYFSNCQLEFPDTCMERIS